jgi:predicted regulator of Ras-like GTPase activity (Roadblock/LC7/MglB family)
MSGFSVPAPPAAPTQPTQPTPVAASDSGTLDFKLSDLWKSWPENLKSGISSHEKATLSIPVKSLTPILQRGKAVFTWLETKDWFKPSIGHTLMGQEDKTELQFPMELLVPAYMKSQKGVISGGALSHPEMDSIPDLFGSRPQVVSSSGSETPPVDARVSSNDQGTESEGLLAPAKFVQEALKLSEVIGAFLASSDGLLIHGELPDAMKKETFAAFIPQIYDRVSKYTKELRLGELNYLSLSIGETGMLILKSSEFYFAALGQQGKPLPLEALGGLMQRLKTN